MAVEVIIVTIMLTTDRPADGQTSFREIGKKRRNLIIIDIFYLISRIKYNTGNMDKVIYCKKLKNKHMELESSGVS